MEGRWRRTTSTAWTGLVLIGLSSSRGSGILRPVSTSCNKCQLTKDTNLIVTLNGRSLPPSPGSVTSRSTCKHIEVNSFNFFTTIHFLIILSYQIQRFISHPCGSHGQRVGCVQTFLSVVNRSSIPKDGDLKVLHHGVHNLPVNIILIRQSHRSQSHVQVLRSIPVHTPWTLLGFDVHLVQVHVHLGDLHLEAVGQKLDGLPHGAIAGSPRHWEQGLGPNGSWSHRENHACLYIIINIAKPENDDIVWNETMFLDIFKLGNVCQRPGRTPVRASVNNCSQKTDRCCWERRSLIMTHWQWNAHVSFSSTQNPQTWPSVEEERGKTIKK